MLPPQLSEKFAALLRTRIDQEYGAPEGEDEFYLEWLQQVLEIDSYEAQEILDGGDISFTEEQLENLSYGLWLDLNLLQVLFFPTSREVMQFAVEVALAAHENEDEQYKRFLEKFGQVGRLEDITPLQELILEVVAYTRSEEGVEPLEADQRFATLWELFRKLSPAGQCRVLAALYEEQERELLGKGPMLPALAAFRDEYLSPLAKKVCDACIAKDEHKLSLKEISRITHMGEARSKTFLDKQLNKGYRLFTAENPGRLPNAPFIWEDNCLVIKPEYALSLRAILMAEKSLQLPPSQE